MTIQELHRFSDIHTHGHTAPDIVTSIEPHQEMTGEYGKAWYSVGIHPWSTSVPVDEHEFELLRQMAAAQGRGSSADYQRDIFLRHVDISEIMEKPLVIHCVGRYGMLMDLHRELRPRQLWIVHGFTGKPELARQLAAEGIAVSLGQRSRPEVADAVPQALLFHETDGLNNFS